eukprot:SAG11_NODE_21034_length_433_cov_1.224551_1_plen_68_part_00
MHSPELDLEETTRRIEANRAQWAQPAQIRRNQLKHDEELAEHRAAQERREKDLELKREQWGLEEVSC